MMRAVLLAALFVAFLFSSPAEAASEVDNQKAHLYAILLGEAAACKIEVKELDRRVMAWIDRTFTGQEKEGVYLAFLTIGMQCIERREKGQAKDSCEDVARVLKKVPMP